MWPTGGRPFALLLALAGVRPALGDLYTMSQQLFLVNQSSNVTVTSKVPAFSASASYKLQLPGGASSSCALVDASNVLCSVTFTSVVASPIDLQSFAPGAASPVVLKTFVVEVYRQPTVASVSPLTVPLSGGQLVRLFFSAPLNSTDYPKVGNMAVRLVRRDTGAYVQNTVQLDGSSLMSVVGRSPDARSFPAGCVADVHLALNGADFVPTGQNVTFVARPLFKIAFIYVSAADDFGWTFQHNIARLQLEKTFFGQVQTMSFEYIPEFGPNVCDVCATMPGWNNKTQNWEEDGENRLMHRAGAIMNDLIVNQGVKLIIAASFWYQSDAYHFAIKFPNASFVHIGGWLTRPNMAQVFPRIEQARYLSGIAMAWYIKKHNLTKRVGFASSFPIGETGRAINSVKLGMEQVDPEIEIYVSWLLTWHDDRKEDLVARRLIQFYDVQGIAQHTDSRTPQFAAKELGRMGVGYNTDMLLTVGDSVLTSPVFTWAADYSYLVQKLMDGDTDINMALWRGAQYNTWRLSDLSPWVPPEATVQIAAELAKFQAGEDRMFCKQNMYDNQGRWRNGPVNPAKNPVPWEAQHLVPGTTCLTDAVVNQLCQEYDSNFNCLGIWLLAGVYDSCSPTPAKPKGIQSPQLPNGTCYIGFLDIPDECQPGEILDLAKGCVKARPGYYALKEKEEPCAEGYYGPTAGLPACVPCPPGSAIAVKGATQCLGCAPGDYADKAAMSACSHCPLGLYSDKSFATQCAFCPLGTFSDSVGLSNCTTCPGTQTTQAIASTNASACVCGRGTYQQPGGCGVCPPGSTTDAIAAPDVSFCLCAQGSYMSKDTTCEICPDSMVCARGSSVSNFALFLGKAERPEQQYPQLKPRFWSSLDDPMSVFECANSLQCVGGDPGQACCGAGLQDQACAHCPEHYLWQGDSCRPCYSEEASKFIFPTLPLVLAPILITILYKMFGDPYPRWGSWQNGMSSALFIVLNHFQIVSLMRQVDIVFPSAVATAYDIWGFTDDVVSVFKPKCAGLGQFQDSMLIKALGPAILALLFLMTWCLFLGISSLARRPAVALENNRLLNVFFSLIFTFFAGISSMAFTLFKCAPNPNGKKTLIADRSVNCFEQEWLDMLVIGIVAVIVWCIGFGLLFCWVVYRSPVNFHNIGFQMRWKFLFIKYRADVHWWALVFVLKGILLNLGFLAMDTAVGKIYWIMGCLLAYAILAILLLPWRHRWVNILDIWAHLCLIIGNSTLVWFAARGVHASDAESRDWGMRNLTIALLFFLTPVLFPVLGYMIYKEESRFAEARKDEVATVMHAMCMHISTIGCETFLDFFRGLGDWDQYYLHQAKNVFAQELCHIRSRSGYSSSELSSSLQDHPSGSGLIRVSERLDKNGEKAANGEAANGEKVVNGEKVDKSEWGVDIRSL